MADDKKIIFSMVGVNKIFPPQKQVLKNIYLSFFYGAKIGIIGLNGSGKSTLLKIIAGIDKDYQGEVVFSPGYSVGYLEQDPKLEPGKTVKEIVQEGVQEIVDTLKEYEEVNERFGDPEVLEDPDKMDALINRQVAPKKGCWAISYLFLADLFGFRSCNVYLWLRKIIGFLGVGRCATGDAEPI